MDKRTQVHQQIRSMILHNFMRGADPSTLEDHISLERSHVVDSVKMLELVLFLEETFGFTVDNDEAVPDNLDTVNNLVAFVLRKT
jgi:acyl carrier protein